MCKNIACIDLYRFLEAVGVRKNADKAIYWLERAVSNSDEETGALLYEMYENGKLPTISEFAVEPK